MNRALFEPVRLKVERLGRRGEGVATHEGRSVYLSYALPDETVLADVDGERGHVRERLVERSDRVPPICGYFETCGGCAVQAASPTLYAEWKRSLVAAALARAGVRADVGPLVDAHGEGRRRATFHARFGPGGAASADAGVTTGFMAARSHRIVDIAACPILAPALAAAPSLARALATRLAPYGKPLDLLLTATEGGVDVDLRGLGPAEPPAVRGLIAAARELGLARLSNHGDVLVEREPPVVRQGRASVVMPPGGFLQATAAGEDALAARVLAAVAPARRVADLFCGVGTFALRLAEDVTVEAVDGDARAVAALKRAAHATPGLKPVSTSVRDLFARPLRAEELAPFDAVVFDPPRAGAATQAAEIARSTVPTAVAVSCDPGTFARDAATLVAGGYALGDVTPVDQFRYAAHVELVAVFRRPKQAGRRRRLLG